MGAEFLVEHPATADQANQSHNQFEAESRGNTGQTSQEAAERNARGPVFPRPVWHARNTQPVIGSNEMITQRLLLEIDSRGSEGGHFVKTGGPCAAG
jgi:hypothetical protein